MTVRTEANFFADQLDTQLSPKTAALPPYEICHQGMQVPVWYLPQRDEKATVPVATVHIQLSRNNSTYCTCLGPD